jgi:competence transcription factor ComK
MQKNPPILIDNVVTKLLMPTSNDFSPAGISVEVP